QDIMKAALESNDAGSKDRFQQALAAMMKIGGTTQAIPLVQKGLRSKNGGLQKVLVHSIGEMGPEAKGLIPDLAALLTNRANRDKVSTRLVKRGKDPTMNRDAVDEVIHVLKTGDKEAKLAAIKTLGAIGPDTKGAAIIPLNQAATGKGDPEIRSAAADALKKVQKKTP